MNGNFYAHSEPSMNKFCKHLLFPWQKSLSKFSYRLINFDNKKSKVFLMNEAYFKHLADEGKIAISFRFIQDISETKKIDRVFNFVRDVNENVEVSMNRIKNNLEKELTKKLKKKTKKNQPVEEEMAEDLQVRLKVFLISSVSLIIFSPI